MKNKLLIIIILFFIKSYSKSDSTFVLVNLKINSEVNFLKKQNDSLAKRLNEIEKNDYKSIEVIEKVNDFYDRSWNKLIVFLSIIGSILLVVLPYYMSKNQDEKINLKTKEFEAFTEKKVDELETKILNFHQEQFEKLKTEILLSQDGLNDNLNAEIKHVQSYIFALRGMLSEKDDNYNLFFKHYIISLNMLIDLEKTKEVESVINALNQRITTCISKKIILKKNIQTRFENLISSLEKNYSEILFDSIENLKANSSKLTYE